MPNEHRADPTPPPHHGQGRGGSKKESSSLRVSPALHPLERPSPRRADIADHGLGRETRERLFSRNVWASKVMYRGSAVNALVVLGIPPQMPQKRSRHMQTIFFGLVARRRLSSSEVLQKGLGRSAEENRGLGGDIRLKSGPYLILFVLLHGGRPGSGRPKTFLENILPQEIYQLVADVSLQCLSCTTQMHTRR